MLAIFEEFDDMQVFKGCEVPIMVIGPNTDISRGLPMVEVVVSLTGRSVLASEVVADARPALLFEDALKAMDATAKTFRYLDADEVTHGLRGLECREQDEHLTAGAVERAVEIQLARLPREKIAAEDSAAQGWLRSFFSGLGDTLLLLPVVLLTKKQQPRPPRC